MNRKRTKIVATISDKRCDPGFIRELYNAGMDVIRINSAHCGIEEAKKIIGNVRAVSDRIAILIDTKGPEIRTTVCDTPIALGKGSVIRVTGEPGKKCEPGSINVTYPDFAANVQAGSQILIDDGEIELKVIGRDGNSLECRVENDALLGSRKSVNVPGARITLPSLTDKDRAFLKMAAEQDIDFIAHSFVRSRQDVLDVQEVLSGAGSEIKIIAKIENQEGVDNIDEILDSVYGIMVARGDLAIEIPFERIPVVQRMIIGKCINRRKPVIVATQMLHTMINNPRPTRAEVSDIASAIYSQTDAIMLSGETANGKYPVEAVKTMTRVALEVENNKEMYLELPTGDISGDISSYLSKVAVKTSIRIGARGIIADTTNGRSIRAMASYRGKNLILAQCYTRRAMRELALSYGIYASYQDRKKSVDEFIHIALKTLTLEHELRDDDIIVVLAGNFAGGTGFSFIEVGSVNYLRDRVNISG
ncbi:MAG TPA: pyruvate kinase [Bacteroidales bacterium]|nr:pyruvate kinase [Bacteroidales bacterium]